jgi:hypothetical protein
MPAEERDQEQEQEQKRPHSAEEQRRAVHPRWSTTEWEASITPSTRLLNQMLGVAPAPRRLTDDEIALMRASKRELAALAFSTRTRASQKPPAEST